MFSAAEKSVPIKKIQLKNVDPNQAVDVRICCISSRQDTYLRVNNKSVPVDFAQHRSYADWQIASCSLPPGTTELNIEAVGLPGGAIAVKWIQLYQ